MVKIVAVPPRLRRFGTSVRSDQHVPEGLHLLEAAPGAERDARQRIVGDRHRQAGGVTQHQIEIRQQRAAAGQHDALVDDVGGELGRGVLERDLDRLDDGADRLGQALGDLALSALSWMARRSTAVEPEGTQMMIWGEAKERRLCTLRMKCLIISSATSKSAITPSRRGRIAWMFPGVRPSIILASSPTARTWRLPLCVVSATTDGSFSTMPRPFT